MQINWKMIWTNKNQQGGQILNPINKQLQKCHEKKKKDDIYKTLSYQEIN